jgi:hypothetical protein
LLRVPSLAGAIANGLQIATQRYIQGEAKRYNGLEVSTRRSLA